ncbi:MAG TPA: RagB/SusD family nutrient uptake outer membrane protein [Lacibacter sp.]|nr:RagB/SusD family nutrient uptake outer membrane protein [Lacibacter sp.]
MKRLNISFLLAGLFLVALQACKKPVDLFPTDFINEANVFQTVNDLDQALLAAYGSWPGENNMYFNAIVADETKISNENRGQGQFEFKWQYVADQGGATTSHWGHYINIGRINKALAAFDKVNARNPAEATQKEQIRGQFLALRALAHFEMLQVYSGRFVPTALGIPYTTTSDLGARRSRPTMAETIAGIEADLLAAFNSPLANAPAASGTAGVIRISKSVVAGIRARVALYKGNDWTNAANFASDCITLSGRSPNTGAAFANIWTDDDNPASSKLLWKIRRTGTSVGTLWQDNNGDVFFEPSDKLKALFNRTTDTRFNTFFLIDPTAQDTCLVRKFFTSARGPKIVDVKLMRLSEMYLIRAEARAESNNLSGAAADYNLVRQNRITGYTNETFVDKTDAINKIYNERARELCFEGFRFYDHVRRGLPIQRPASDVQSLEWQTLAADNFRFKFPIPGNSIRANPNMVQNPGY